MWFRQHGNSFWGVMLTLGVIGTFLLVGLVYRPSIGFVILAVLVMVFIITLPFIVYPKIFLNKVHVDDYGITCYRRKKTIWSCTWNEIGYFRWGAWNGTYCREIILKRQSEVQCYFEMNPKASKVIKKYCPREDLLTQLRKPIFDGPSKLK